MRYASVAWRLSNVVLPVVCVGAVHESTAVVAVTVALKPVGGFGRKSEL
jgi:hypothetical protein